MGPGGANALSATGASDPPASTGRRVRHLQGTAQEGPPGHRLRRARPRAHCKISFIDRTASEHRASGRLPVQAARRGPPQRMNVMEIAICPPSAIRTGQLQSVTRCPPPAYQPGGLPGALPLSSGDARLGVGFPLRCFQRFARPDVATQRCRLSDNWNTSGPSSPVLSY
jgi:hypothetical protein